MSKRETPLRDYIVGLVAIFVCAGVACWFVVSGIPRQVVRDISFFDQEILVTKGEQIFEVVRVPQPVDELGWNRLLLAGRDGELELIAGAFDPSGKIQKGDLVTLEVWHPTFNSGGAEDVIHLAKRVPPATASGPAWK